MYKVVSINVMFPSFSNKHVDKTPIVVLHYFRCYCIKFTSVVDINKSMVQFWRISLQRYILNFNRFSQSMRAYEPLIHWDSCGHRELECKVKKMYGELFSEKETHQHTIPNDTMRSSRGHHTIPNDTMRSSRGQHTIPNDTMRSSRGHHTDSTFQWSLPYIATDLFIEKHIFFPLNSI